MGPGGTRSPNAFLGSKFWALGGLNQKSKNNVLSRGTSRNDGQKMANRETKKKKQFEVCDRQTDRLSQLLSLIDS